MKKYQKTTDFDPVSILLIYQTNMNKYIFILIGLCEKAGIIEVSLSTPLI